MALSAYPDVSLAEARAARDQDWAKASYRVSAESSAAGGK